MAALSRSVESLFSASLEIANLTQRAAYLDEACGGDTELRQRVEALIQADADAGSFLDKPIDIFDATADGTADETDGDRSGAWATNLTFLAPCDKPDRLGALRGKAGDYEIIELVGHGGMGAVLRALDTKLNRIVAVKVMAPELAASPMAVRRFLREAQAAAAVHHDNVVTIHAIDEEHRPPFLVMEFIDGQTLGQKIERRGSLELTHILRIGSQVASGLAAAHKLGLIHRDVKPTNILLQNSVERVKITDFGLARAADDLEVTQAGLIAGTPQYMSPEQAKGETIDTRSDLFSLGSVLYAMCTGRSPFRAETTIGALRRVCDDTPRPISQLNHEPPPWLEAIVLKLLAKNPADRFQSAVEVAELLGQHLAHLQNPAQVPQPAMVVLGPPLPAATSSPVAVVATPQGRGWTFATLAFLLGVLLLLVVASMASFGVGPAARWFRPQDSKPTDATAHGPLLASNPQAMIASEKDRLQPGTVWSGSRSYRKGGWAGKTVTYYLHVRERDGQKFRGHVFDNGPQRNRAEVDGEIQGSSVSWREQTVYPDNHVNVRGTIVGNTIRLTLQGERTDGSIYTEGDGELVLTANE